MDDRPARSRGSDRSGRRRRPAGSPLPLNRTLPRRHRNYSLQLAKLVLAMVSVLVLGLTGYGWATFKTLHEGLSTTDVIGWAVPDRATDLLLVGLDSRTDAHDNPLAPDVLARLRAGDNEGELTDT
ncbi:MAG: LCP family protein, partial [Pseudonocardiaceae bacterium]